MNKWLFLLIATWSVASFQYTWGQEATSETLFLRENAPNGEEIVNARETEQFFGDAWPRERIRKEYSSRSWGPEILKVELMTVSRQSKTPPYINDPAYVRILDGTPYAKLTFVAKVLFDRPLEDPDAEKLAISESHEWFEEGTTADQIKQKYASYKWEADKKTIRVEIRYGDRMDKPPYVKPYLSVRAISGYKVNDKERAALDVKRRDLLKAFAIGKGIAGYKNLGTSDFGMIGEVYAHPEKGGINVCYIEIPGQLASGYHEFVRNFVGADAVLQTANHGPIILISHKNLKRDDKKIYDEAAWLTDDTHMLLITCLAPMRGSSPMDVLPLYAEKYPSVLPADFKINLESWARQEIETSMASMSEAIEAERSKTRIDYWDSSYELSLQRIEKFMFVQWATEIPPLPHDLNTKRKIHARIQEWWNANKNNAHWDNVSKKLVVTMRQSAK